MTELEQYTRLAKILDSLPNGFPSTKSGIELRLLAKIFAPDEASMACNLTLDAEPARAVADKAGLDPRQTRDILKRMAAKGLIDVRRGEGEFFYALRPFVVGFYEGQLPRMDKEMAGLFEEYYREMKGDLLRQTPALHRVIPIGRTIRANITIDPYPEAVALIEKAQSWGVRECICRKQQHLVGKGCTHDLENCLTFAPVKNAFDRSTVDRAISKDEALRILRETEEAGLIHSSGNYVDGIDYICNCCTCCCAIMRGVTEYGILSAIAHSDYRIELDESLCNNCAACIDRCKFNALSIPDTRLVIDLKYCLGCGLCTLSCPSEALRLRKRDLSDILALPRNIREWREQRLRR